MFTEIKLIDFRKTTAQRKADYAFTSGYSWRPPASPRGGLAFYMSSCGLAMAEHGATMRLRLTWVNDHLAGSRLSHTRGYYCDTHQSETLKPIVAYLPHARRYLAGWT